ncbi:hypothetical protein FRB91_009453 [Serendipita sp. 411]|nr:hypothetical protein FRB91_009453 [Serendipita sp. 411]
MERETKKVLIVGAGCFGLSTAFYLLHDGHDPVTPELASQGQKSRYQVTIIDSSDSVPAIDSASYDLNKIVRTSYSDKFYTALAKEAIGVWKAGNVCGSNIYHESGVLIVGLRDDGSSDQHGHYADEGLRNDIEAGARIRYLNNPPEVLSVLPEGVNGGAIFHSGKAFLNQDGGWASATKAMEAILQNVKDLGADVKVNAKFKDLSYREDGRLAGVVLEDGRVLQADLVVLAMGAWTPSNVPCSVPDEVRSALYKLLIATGQPVLTIKMPQEIAKRYQDVPVTINWETGVCTFPPNEEGIFKFIHHSNGYTYESPLQTDELRTFVNSESRPSTHNSIMVSTPRTLRSHGVKGTQIPSDLLQYLHEQLKATYPELAKYPLDTTRLCWYMDTPDENFLIDCVPGFDGSLFIATGGSGHAFKVLL